eukprot:2353097-Pyramimonas_sp.AAC.1
MYMSCRGHLPRSRKTREGRGGGGTGGGRGTATEKKTSSPPMSHISIQPPGTVFGAGDHRRKSRMRIDLPG